MEPTRRRDPVQGVQGSHAPRGRRGPVHSAPECRPVRAAPRPARGDRDGARIVRSSTAHFRITGEAFTSLVRQRMLDDAPDAAYHLATSIGSGDPAVDDTIPKIAQRLCDGVAALDGDERSMRVVDEADDEYR